MLKQIIAIFICVFFLGATTLFAAEEKAAKNQITENESAEKIELNEEDKEIVRIMEILKMMELLEEMEMIEDLHLIAEEKVNEEHN